MPLFGQSARRAPGCARRRRERGPGPRPLRARRAGLALGPLVALLVAAPPASAQSLDEPTTYRLPILAADLGGALVVPLVLSGPLSGGTPTAAFVAWAGLYALGAPTVHLLHHRPEAALAAFGLRVAVMSSVLTTFVVTRTQCHDGTSIHVCQTDAALDALAIELVGAAVATTVDTLFLAHEAPLPIPPGVATAPRLRLLPALAPTAGGLALGLLGLF